MLAWTEFFCDSCFVLCLSRTPPENTRDGVGGERRPLRLLVLVCRVSAGLSEKVRTGAVPRVTARGLDVLAAVCRHRGG